MSKKGSLAERAVHHKVHYVMIFFTLVILTIVTVMVALHRFNAEGCSCGCQFTLAQCRIYDRGCAISKGRTTKIIAEVSGHATATPAHKSESPKLAPAAPIAETPNPNPTRPADIP